MDASKLQQLNDLAGRTAIVTGGSRGIGRSVAQGLALAGANVVVSSRKTEACDAAAAEITAAGGTASAQAAHMGDLDDIDALVRHTVDRFGGVDIIVNNAANALALPLGQITREAFDKSHHVNVQGPVFLVQAALEELKASEHASVINVISVGAFMFAGGTGLYSSAKAALAQFTRSMAAELAPSGVRINALAPGSVDTDMVRNTPPESQAGMAKASLMGRIAHPDEMVGPVLFLAGDASSYMTGQVLVVDGGLLPH